MEIWQNLLNGNLKLMARIVLHGLVVSDFQIFCAFFYCQRPTTGKPTNVRTGVRAAGVKIGAQHTHTRRQQISHATFHLPPEVHFFVLSAAGAGEMKTERPDNKKVSDFPWQRVDYLSWYLSSADYKRRFDREPVGVALHHPAAR